MAATTVEELRRFGERLRPQPVAGGILIYEKVSVAVAEKAGGVCVTGWLDHGARIPQYYRAPYANFIIKRLGTAAGYLPRMVAFH